MDGADTTIRDQSDFASRWAGVHPSVAAFIAASVRDVHHAEDVLQEVAREAYLSFEKYDASRPFVHWVLGIARHRVLRHYRKMGSERLVFNDQVLQRVQAAHESLAGEIPARRQALQHCLDKLHRRLREMVELRYEQLIPVQEIAKRLDITPNAASLGLFRARAALRECIASTLGRRSAIE